MIIKIAEKKDIDNLNLIQSLCFDKAVFEDFNFLIDNKSYIVLTVNDNDTLIGYLSASVSFESSDLLQICVLSEYRRKNYAGQLLQFYFDYAKNLGAKEILLEVNENNIPAIKLYEKNGFQTISVRKNYYGKDSAIIMKKDL